MISARHMADDFEQSQHGLHRCQVEVLEGLVFISLASRDNAEFNQIRRNLLPYLKPHDLAQTKVVHREVYPTHANWKLVVENIRECYHCLPSHPQYTQVNDYVRAGERGSKPIRQCPNGSRKSRGVRVENPVWKIFHCLLNLTRFGGFPYRTVIRH